MFQVTGKRREPQTHLHRRQFRPIREHRNDAFRKRRPGRIREFSGNPPATTTTVRAGTLHAYDASDLANGVMEQRNESRSRPDASGHQIRLTDGGQWQGIRSQFPTSSRSTACSRRRRRGRNSRHHYHRKRGQLRPGRRFARRNGRHFRLQPRPVHSQCSSMRPGLSPTTLADTQVLFDGVASPLIFASAGQVDAVVPCRVPPTTRWRYRCNTRARCRQRFPSPSHRLHRYLLRGLVPARGRLACGMRMAVPIRRQPRRARFRGDTLGHWSGPNFARRKFPALLAPPSLQRACRGRLPPCERRSVGRLRRCYTQEALRAWWTG